MRDGAIVALSTPNGAPLLPAQRAVDAKLGVVVLAHRGGSTDEPNWIHAEHAPVGIRDSSLI